MQQAWPWYYEFLEKNIINSGVPYNSNVYYLFVYIIHGEINSIKPHALHVYMHVPCMRQ